MKYTLTGAFIGGFSLGLALYLWAGLVSTQLRVPNPSNLSMIYGILFAVVLSMAVMVDSLGRKGVTLIASTLIVSYLLPLLYVLFTDPGIARYVAELTAVLSVPGLIPGLMVSYKGNSTKEGILKRLAISLTLFNIIANMVIEGFTGITFPDFVLLNSMFITAGLSVKQAAASPILVPAQQTRYRQARPRATGQPRQVRGNPQKATVILGLPPNCVTVAYVNGTSFVPVVDPQYGPVLEFNTDTLITLVPTVCQGVTYTPVRTSVRAEVGKVTIVNYIPLTPGSQPTPQPRTSLTTPSKVLGIRSLNDWDPQIWVNRRLSVYQVKKVIGEGGNGYVLKGEVNGKNVAIKVFKLYGGTPDEYFNELASEASNLINLSRHSNIVKIYAVDADSFIISDILKGNLNLYLSNPPMIVMELMEGGTLKDILEDDNFFYSSMWKRAVLRAICEVATALDYIHSQGFVHMDVKPQNIFLDSKPKDPYSLGSVHFKLGDLGSAVRVNGRIKQVTPEYAPPDVFRGTASQDLDIFALGMTAYVLLSRKIGRPDLDEMNDALDCYIRKDMACVRDKVEKAKVKLMWWNFNIDPSVDVIIRSMVSVDPGKRPRARDVVSMIKGLDPTIC
ncbi:protein kinase domain-containing protein [Stygiolobus caldivivus]|uniref:Protein kinase domain-containing protein n=1 Tax=Stygiolobus caldivivus TaxID=2824673 RepID=A0A8D5U6D7_9CREN|nr:protein kinase [Stygiolobus caldivivus]BCU69832.1 hypothetical protein KN1_11290 [Stygiolobus caldivivus]